MSPTTNPSRRTLSRPGRLLAGTVAATLAVTGLSIIGAQSARAADKPLAQSVGNFLDAKLGGQTLDAIAKLDYASAQAPGSASVQNPLHVKALNAIDLPLTGALQLPQLLGIDLGAANQVASANVNGQSFGAAGAVNNSGGVSVGGSSTGTPPASASIDACASALTAGKCTSTGTDALGTVSAKIGAVSALAQTPKGYGKPGTTNYAIAGLDLTLSSPLVGSLLTPVTSTLASVLTQLTGALGALLPATCTLAPDLNFDDGVLTIDAATGQIGISVQALLDALGLDLNTLPANTDLIAKVLGYLTSPAGLAKGLETIIDGLVTPLEAQLDACLPSGVVGTLLTTVQGLLDTGKSTLESTVNSLLASLSGAAGTTLLKPVTDLLKQVIDIGVNVQPNGAKGDFTSQLAATPKQGTAVVPGQTIVRAIEVDLIGDPLATVALANAAAGPSAAAPPAPATPAAPSTTPNPNAIPNGVPAGMGTHGGTPVAPIVLLIVGLMMAAGGAVAFKIRANHVG
jgi:hypothetical protein